MLYHLIADDTGRVLAALSYCALPLAESVAKEYARVLACTAYIVPLHFNDIDSVPKIASYLPKQALIRSRHFTRGD